MAYYIYRMGAAGLDSYAKWTHDITKAKRIADDMQRETGHHHMVLKIESVWATKTLDELVEEDRAAEQVA